MRFHCITQNHGSGNRALSQPGRQCGGAKPPGSAFPHQDLEPGTLPRFPGLRDGDTREGQDLPYYEHANAGGFPKPAIDDPLLLLRRNAPPLFSHATTRSFPDRRHDTRISLTLDRIVREVEKIRSSIGSVKTGTSCTSVISLIVDGYYTRELWSSALLSRLVFHRGTWRHFCHIPCRSGNRSRERR